MQESAQAIALDLVERKRLVFSSAARELFARMPHLGIDGAQDAIAQIFALNTAEREALERELFHTTESTKS